MPIFVDPNTPIPVPPDTVTSPDGILTGTYIPGTGSSDYCQPFCQRYPCDSDAAESQPGGIYLTADFPDQWTTTSNQVIDPGFTDRNVWQKRFPAAWLDGTNPSGGKLTIPDSADSYRVWLIGWRVASTSSAAPTFSSGDLLPVTGGQVLKLSLQVEASIADREVRYQIARYASDGSVINGATYFKTNTAVPGPDQPMTVAGDYTIPDDGTSYVAVAFVAEGGFGGTVTVSKPNIRLSYVKQIDGVRFIRVDPDGTEENVRGGDPATAVGGQAYAFDAEVPLGVCSSWYAVPIYSDGTEGSPSEEIVMCPPWPDGPLDCWLKPIADLNASTMGQILQPLPNFTYASRNQLSPVQGARLQAGGWDLHLAPEATFTFWTPDCITRQQIITALTQGPLLLQCHPDYQVDDVYVLAGDITEVPVETTFHDPGRTWTVPLTPVARPATAGSPAVVWGRTYADTHAAAGTYEIRYELWPTYADATRPQEIPATGSDPSLPALHGGEG